MGREEVDLLPYLPWDITEADITEVDITEADITEADITEAILVSTLRYHRWRPGEYLGISPRLC